MIDVRALLNLNSAVVFDVVVQFLVTMALPEYIIYTASMVYIKIGFCPTVTDRKSVV